MNATAWKLLGTGAAVLAGTLANKTVSRAWKLVSGREAPSDPLNTDDVSWREALLFAAITGFAVQAARVAVQRKASQFYGKSDASKPAPLRGRR